MPGADNVGGPARHVRHKIAALVAFGVAVVQCATALFAGCASLVPSVSSTAVGGCDMGPSIKAGQGVWATASGVLAFGSKSQSAWTDGSAVFVALCGLEQIPASPPALYSNGQRAAAMGMQLRGNSDAIFVYPYQGWTKAELSTASGATAFEFGVLPRSAESGCPSSVNSGGPVVIVACGMVTVMEWRTSVTVGSAAGLFTDVELVQLDQQADPPAVTVMAAERRVVNGKLLVRVGVLANRSLSVPIRVRFRLRQLVPSPPRIRLPIYSPSFTYAPVMAFG